MTKPVLRIFILGLGSLLVLALFQNCGPTFVADEFGQVQMSSFQGPIEYPSAFPSEVRSDFPASVRNGARSTSISTCQLNSVCSNGVYLRARN